MGRVEFDRLSKSYRNYVALEPVSLDVASGVVAITGPNGSGKTTLFRRALEMVSGGGCATFDGLRFRQIKYPRRHVGVSFGPTYIDGQVTAKALLAAHAAASRWPSKAITQTLEEVGLSQVQHRRVSRLSAGMKQRLSIALAVMCDPGTIILDEPETGLDSNWQEWLYGLIANMRLRGATVLISTHVNSQSLLKPDIWIDLERGVSETLSPNRELEDVIVGCSTSLDFAILMSMHEGSDRRALPISSNAVWLQTRLSLFEFENQARRKGVNITEFSLASSRGEVVE